MIKKTLAILLVTSLIFILFGCQSKSTESTKNSPPSQVDTIESDAEDIIDDITNNDWSAAQGRVTEIKAEFSALNSKLESTGVKTEVINGLSSAISGLETAVNANKSYEARVQANQISKYIPDISDYYTVTLPTDVGRMDYIGREILLNVENSDWSSASSNYNTASDLWTTLKSQLDSTYNKDIDNFQSNMDSLKTAIANKDTSLTTTQSNALLENVDVLENDFTAQNK